MSRRKPPLPKIQSWADIPDSAFNVFQCDGCGKEDVTMWALAGVDHYSLNVTKKNTVCGVFRFVKPYDPQRSPQLDHSRDAELFPRAEDNPFVHGAA